MLLMECISQHRLITHGVPHGSIFVNDPPCTVSRSTVDIYADDTTLSTSAAFTNLPKVQQRLHEDEIRVADWILLKQKLCL